MLVAWPGKLHHFRDQGSEVILAISRHNSRIWQDLRKAREVDLTVTHRDDIALAGEPEMSMLTTRAGLS